MRWVSGGLFLLMMLFCGSGEATVKCYLCSTKDNEKVCLNPEGNDVPVVQCDLSALERTKEFATKVDPSYRTIFEVDTNDMSRHLDLDCLKVVTKLGNRNFTFRGCQLAEQSSLDICYKLKKANTDFLTVQHCSRCGKDRCNSAPSSFTVFLLIPLVSSMFVFSF